MTEPLGVLDTNDDVQAQEAVFQLVVTFILPVPEDQRLPDMDVDLVLPSGLTEAEYGVTLEITAEALLEVARRMLAQSLAIKSGETEDKLDPNHGLYHRYKRDYEFADAQG